MIPRPIQSLLFVYLGMILRYVCVECLFLRSPSRAEPLTELLQRAPKGRPNRTPPRSPRPRIHRCPGVLYRGSIATAGKERAREVSTPPMAESAGSKRERDMDEHGHGRTWTWTSMISRCLMCAGDSKPLVRASQSESTQPLWL